MKSRYILQDVGISEYQHLKKFRNSIIGQLMKLLEGGIYPANGLDAVADFSFSFKYSYRKNLIGIFIRRNGVEKIVLSDKYLKKREKIAVDFLYRTLEISLNIHRIEQGMDLNGSEIKGQ